MIGNLYNNIAKKINEIVFVVSIALIVATLNIFPVILGAAKTLPGQIYLAAGHYYVDYLVYLQAIVQGTRGNWLYRNPYTGTDFSQTAFIYWPYLALGEIGRLFHLSAFFLYWLAVFIFSVGIIVLAYWLIKKLLFNNKIALIALLFFLFSTPLYFLRWEIGGLKPAYVKIWYSYSTLADKFRPVPHHLLAYILTLLALILMGQILLLINKKLASQSYKKIIILYLIIFLLLTIYPYYALNFILASIIISLILIFNRKKAFLFTLTTALFILAVGFVFKNWAKNFPAFAQAGQYDLPFQEHPAWRYVLLDLGPLIIFALFGLKSFFKKMNEVRIVVFSFVLASFILYFSSANNLIGTFNQRFLGPVNYILLGSLGILGIESITSLWKKSRRFGLILLLLLILISFIPLNIKDFKERLNDPNLNSRLTRGHLQGILALKNYPREGCVLTTPYGFFGLAIPVFVDRKVCLGRIIFVSEYEKKEGLNYLFYQGKMTENEAKSFIQANNVTYVFLASTDGYQINSLTQYPFLRQVFNNGQVVIFKTLK